MFRKGLITWEGHRCDQPNIGDKKKVSALESTFILTFFIQQPPLQVEADAGKIKDSPRDQTVSLQQTRQSKFINSSSEAQVSIAAQYSRRKATVSEFKQICP